MKEERKMASDESVTSLEEGLRSKIESLEGELKLVRRALVLLAATEIRANYDRPFSEVMDAVVGYVLDGKRPNVTGWKCR